MEFSVTFKDDVDPSDLRKLTPSCGIIMVEFINWCRHKKLPCRITSLISDRKNVKAVSTTHEDGRAFDASTHGWDHQNIEDCTFHFNTYFRNLAAISAKDLKPRAVIYHDAGLGSHLHFQVRR